MAARETPTELFKRALAQSTRALAGAEEELEVTFGAEGPRIAPHRAAMRARIAELLRVGADDVNVKGKSLEGLGALAGGAGVAVQAVCLLQRDP